MATRKPASKSKAPPKPASFQRLTATLARAEVGGVVLILLSAVTLLSLLTRSNGIITAALIDALQTLFGVGMWGFPLVTGALGLWMVIRAIEQLPDLPWQRPVGLGTLFLAGIIGATLWMQPEQEAAGGQIGLLLANSLQNVIGNWGAWMFVGLLAVIGVILLTDQWLPNTTVDLWYLGQEWRQQKRSARRSPFSHRCRCPAAKLAGGNVGSKAGKSCPSPVQRRRRMRRLAGCPVHRTWCNQTRLRGG